MPFNITVFKTRALTAVLFAAIMLAGLFWSQWTLLLLFAIIHFGCWFEFVRLLRKIPQIDFRRYLPAGLLYITIPVLLLLHLSHPFIGGPVIKTSYFPVGCWLIVLSIWVNDTMAYVIGSWLGKTPLSRISPKKTWEGTVGGALLAVLIIGIFGPALFPGTSAPVIAGWRQQISGADYFIIAAICAVFGTLGDLFESKLKRLAGVKDSGSIMPGHGGFLDRFDSFLVATPFVWLYIYITGR